MAFFDLNIPYDPNPATKPNRTRIAMRCTELGYTGIAYNRTIKGVMSDHDRCSIPPLPASFISSLLFLSPSFADSVRFHRGLLGSPLSSPFRQYTRLTVLVETPAQGHALNAGNPVVRTYDLVAARPLNQPAFDQACQKSEVDIIAIDFREKLPFRLKLPMVKAALKRGVYFEIVYSGLLGDAQVRRQMISNAQLLVNWTRGKNLIFSSGAPSVAELRGPYDAANLSSLLGLSMERAKAAISKNCRDLMCNALRKKNFYKEAIKVELVPSEKRLNSKELISADWLNLDPLSSGEGDLQLDDVLRSFSDTTRASKTVKAIDFSSIIDGLPPAGLSLNLAKRSEFLVAPVEADQTSGPNNMLNQMSDGGSSLESQCQSETCATVKEIGTPARCLEEKMMTLIDADMPSEEVHADSNRQHLSKSTVGSDNVINQNDEMMHRNVINLDISPENLQLSVPVAEISINCHSSNADAIMGNLPERLGCSHSLAENTMLNMRGSDAMLGSEKYDRNENMMEIDRNHEEGKSIRENILGVEQLGRSVDDIRELVDQTLKVDAINLEVEDVANYETQEDVPDSENKLKDVDADATLASSDEFEVEHISSGTNYWPNTEVAVEECKQEAIACSSGSSALPISPAGQTKAKSKAPHRPVLFPLKRLLNPVSFKKARKSKRMMKMVR